MLTRRAFLTASSALVCGCALGRAEAAPRHVGSPDIEARLRGIGQRTGGRLGVHALDTASGRRIDLHGDERFAMASTFKLPLAAAVLERCDRGLLALDTPVPYSERDLVPHAPLTEQHLARGFMTVEELCAAIVTVSDNPAANLLLATLGGPAALTRFVRGLGDTVTRLDRIEPELNENSPGDLRDTTSPRAMADTLQRLLTGEVLQPASRDRLIGWLITAQTGLERIRAGLPNTWRTGDKTGTGGHNAVNDVAITWPPGRAPIVIAIYTSGSPHDLATLNRSHADVAAVVASALGA